MQPAREISIFRTGLDRSRRSKLSNSYDISDLLGILTSRLPSGLPRQHIFPKAGCLGGISSFGEGFRPGVQGFSVQALRTKISIPPDVEAKYPVFDVVPRRLGATAQA